ncbi:(2Fe-2S)-binding protein [Saccharopolyspora phatthalungensis]|uniref:Xanthine dehydrogenase YagT iron-sulfur-binding subunit n=1 Tax=Saccharopolyspora phatthalungensis TaxID=664693 RepID=A0A840QKV8_9PSEU|nr:(2Fe-2S)-binding protein [Saccharopolyspora phatthalungensis]MBB5159593.1 xanthine dehydrogenase YagT iron-sulfur-binding subunit [Saccharopolyspora phatthalungensis]
MEIDVAVTGARQRQPVEYEIELEVNGASARRRVDPRTTLADLLRDRLGLTGTKISCNQGTCGACTMQIDGERVLSCLTLAVTVQGRRVTTIEGLAGDPDAVHPLQEAFVAHDALQCGFCTPGQIVSAEACIREGHAATDADIREYMSGNLCRCAAYPAIVAAIRSVATFGNRRAGFH